MLWYDESGEVQHRPRSVPPASLVIDTSGAGDVFHGAYVTSYLGQSGRHDGSIISRFARAASAFKVQHLGNEAGLPSLADVDRMRREYAVVHAVPAPTDAERQSALR